MTPWLPCDSQGPMDGSHPVKLYRHGPSQAVDIPAALELPGEDAVMRREGNRLVIEPICKMTTGADLLAALSKLSPIDDEIGEIEDFPPRPVNF